MTRMSIIKCNESNEKEVKVCWRSEEVIFEDNKACIDYTKNSTNHPRTKHIDTKYHFIRDLVQQDIIKLEPVKSADNIADIFTKPLATQSFLYLRNKFMTLISDYDSLGNVIPHEDIGILNET